MNWFCLVCILHNIILLFWFRVSPESRSSCPLHFSIHHRLTESLLHNQTQKIRMHFLLCCVCTATEGNVKVTKLFFACICECTGDRVSKQTQATLHPVTRHHSHSSSLDIFSFCAHHCTNLPPDSSVTLQKSWYLQLLRLCNHDSGVRGRLASAYYRRRRETNRRQPLSKNTFSDRRRLLFTNHPNCRNISHLSREQLCFQIWIIL